MRKNTHGACSVQRRLARRVPITREVVLFGLLLLAVVAIPLMTMVTWLPRGDDAGPLGAALRWACISVFLGVAVLGLFLGVAMWVVRGIELGSRPRLAATISGPDAGAVVALYALVPAVGAWFLLMERVDLAGYAVFGAEMARGLYGRRRTGNRAYWPSLAQSLVGITGVAVRNPWLICLGFSTSIWYSLRGLWLWRAAVAGPVGALAKGKPGIVEYLSSARIEVERNGRSNRLIQALMDAHRWTEALDEVRRFGRASAYNDCAAARYRLQILNELGRSALVLATGESGAQYALALARTGDIEPARDYAADLISRRVVGSERALGRIYAEASQVEPALYWLERACRRLGADSDTWRDVARALMSLGLFGEAVVAWRMAVWRAGCVLPDDLHALAECLDHMGREREASEARSIAARHNADGGQPAG